MKNFPPFDYRIHPIGLALRRPLTSAMQTVRRRIATNKVSRTAGQAVLVAGLGGLLVWPGVRASHWLQAELAYHRWRRQRVHAIILRSPRGRPDTLPSVEPSASIALRGRQAAA